jgi:sugar diacid utilization regulator
MAVFGGSDVLGAILLFHRNDLNETAIRTFERSANVIGVVLLSQERSEAGKTRDAAIFLRSLVSLRQDPLPVLADQAERFGLDVSQPISLVIIQTEGSRARYAARRLRSRPELSNVVLDELDGMVAIVCSTTRAKGIVHAVVTMGKPEFGSAYRGVLSRPVSSLAEVPALYSTLRRALAVLARIGVQGDIIGQSELALYSTLFETHDRSSLEGFLQATIGALISRDQRRGSELASTLLVYFDSNQNATTAAQRLGIHVNTVRQRLASIEELIGHWGSAVRALEIHMALRLWDLSHPEAD